MGSSGVVWLLGVVLFGVFGPLFDVAGHLLDRVV